MLSLARLAVIAAVILLLAAFVVAVRRAQRGREESGRKTGPASAWGMLFEFVAFIVIFMASVPDPELGDEVYAAAAVLALASVALSVAAALHLGRQLRIQAVVTDQHELITSGPYALLRHPIYASLLGLLVASALVFSGWRILLLAVPLYLIGTEIRVQTEDKLLSAHFGPEFDEYRSRVKAYLPYVR